MVGLKAFYRRSLAHCSRHVQKFVLADMLARRRALNPISATQVTSTGGLWLLLYGYAFPAVFDFSGYTDIAIGLGLLFASGCRRILNGRICKQTSPNFGKVGISPSAIGCVLCFFTLSRSLLRCKPRLRHQLGCVRIPNDHLMIVIGLWVWV